MNKFFIDTIQEKSMEQSVDFPTSLDNIIELVFTTHPVLWMSANHFLESGTMTFSL